MTEAGLKVVSFRGNNLFNSDYEAYFVGEEGQAFDTNKAETIETPRVGLPPEYGRTQPDGIRLSIEVHIKSGVTQANVDRLKLYFSTDPSLEQGWLIATSGYGAGTNRRLQCASEGLTNTGDINIFKAIVRSSEGIWEEVDEDTGSKNVTNTGDTFDIACDGTFPNFPSFDITPNAVKDDTVDYNYRRRVLIANKSPLPLDHAIGDGYPIELTNGGLDTSTLQGASKVLANLNDLRVLNNSEEIYRWTSPSGAANAATKIWSNLQIPPTKQATLAATINNSATALTISDPEGLIAWPNSGVVVIDNEAIIYTERTNSALITMARGKFNTSAASHTAGATLYVVELKFLNVIYGNSGAGAADAPTERQPIIDLATSTNLGFSWPTYFNVNDRRSATWIRLYTNENAGSQYVRCYETGGVMYFENAYGESGKPRANNAILDTPCGLRVITLSYASVGSIPMAEGLTGTGAWKKVTTDIVYTYIFVVDGWEEATKDTTVVEEFVSARGVEVDDRTYYALNNSGHTTIVDSSDTAENRTARLHTEHTETYETFDPDENKISATPGALSLNKYVVDSDGYESRLAGTSPALQIFRIRLNCDFPIGIDTSGDEFQSIPEVSKSTGAYITIQSLSIDFVTSLTPKILFGAEEAVYVNQGRLTNDTNGSYLDIFWPQALSQTLRINCATRKVTDLETGFEVPFAVVLGQDTYPYNTPGVTNTWSWTEPGVNDTDIDWSKRDRWH